MRDKYVKVADTRTEKQCFTVSNSYTYGIKTEIKRCLSYLDTKKKIFNWEQIMLDLKNLAKSSSLLRLGSLNQDLYTDLSIN